MNMMITLQSIRDGFFRVKIRPFVGESYFREFTPEALQEFIDQAEAYAEWKGYDLPVFIIPDSIKKMASQWFKNLTEQK